MFDNKICKNVTVPCPEGVTIDLSVSLHFAKLYEISVENIVYENQRLKLTLYGTEKNFLKWKKAVNQSKYKNMR